MSTMMMDTSPFPVGKHKGTPMCQVPADYYVWFMRQDWKDKYQSIVSYVHANAEIIKARLRAEKNTKAAYPAKQLTDSDLFPFGKNKAEGKTMRQVDAKYYAYFMDQEWRTRFKSVLDYVKRNKTAINSELEDLDQMPLANV